MVSEVARLSLRHASHNLDNMRDFADNRQNREVTKKIIGYKMKFYVPSSFVPYNENIRIVYGDFVTENVNPSSAYRLTLDPSEV